MSIMHTLTGEGDVRATWDATRPAEVEAARATFTKLTRPRSQGGEGYLAYRTEGEGGRRGIQLRDFDPEAERVILVQPPVGG